MSTLMALGLGVLLGMQHATEADHLAAVATLVGRERSVRRGLRHGVAWGLGHTCTLLLVAGGAGLAGWVISPQWAGRFEQAVGAMLVLLGASLAWRLWHEPAGPSQGRIPECAARRYTSERAPLPLLQPTAGPRVPARSLIVGMVHGLAGSAALALMVGQALPTAAGQLAYIALFGAGSIAGMAVLSLAVALPMKHGARHFAGMHRALNAGFACLSVALGLRLLLVLG